MKAFKKHINFGFWWGIKLADPQELLEGSGDKMRHVKISDPDDVKTEAFKALVRKSIAANRQFGDPTRTKAN